MNRLSRLKEVLNQIKAPWFVSSGGTIVNKEVILELIETVESLTSVDPFLDEVGDNMLLSKCFVCKRDAVHKTDCVWAIHNKKWREES